MLSINASLGLRGGLTTRGPYRYSRNPQYVGAALFFAGFMVAFNSLFAYITGTMGIALFILAHSLRNHGYANSTRDTMNTARRYHGSLGCDCIVRSSHPRGLASTESTIERVVIGG